MQPSIPATQLRMPHGHGMSMMVFMLLAQKADADRDHQVTRAEWDALLADLVSDDGTIKDTALKNLLPAPPEGAPPPVSLFDMDQDGKVTLEELKGLFGHVDRNDDGTIDQGELLPRPPPATR